MSIAVRAYANGDDALIAWRLKPYITGAVQTVVPRPPGRNSLTLWQGGTPSLIREKRRQNAGNARRSTISLGVIGADNP